MKNSKLGQSVVELVMAVSIIILVVTGVVALTVSNVNSKSRGFDRKKATNIAQVVMEDLLQKKKNESSNFWTLNIETIGLPDICNSSSNYVCSVALTSVACGSGSCANATVRVGWSGSGTQEVIFNRLFSKEGN